MGGRRFVKEIEDTVLARVAPPEEVAAVFVEPIQGEGGYNVPPDDFLPALRDLCDRHGMLLVADEVQSGMGRTGKLFACEHWDVEPDILCTAKGIASGMPLGAILAKADIMDWPSGSHASTFGGNPVSCRAALATLDLLEQGYMENAAVQGARLHERLLELKTRHSAIGDVRGLGLMRAMDLQNPAHGNLPDPVLRDRLVEAAFERGLLLLGCGKSAIRFCPPLCITAAQVDAAIQILDELLASQQVQTAVA
jgi:4-aminobutyrate aminotransferase